MEWPKISARQASLSRAHRGHALPAADANPTTKTADWQSAFCWFTLLVPNTFASMRTWTPALPRDHVYKCIRAGPGNPGIFLDPSPASLYDENDLDRNPFAFSERCRMSL